MAAVHWRDPVTPRFSTSDAAVAIVVVLTERAAAAGQGRRLLTRSASIGRTAVTGLTDNPIAVAVAHIGVGRMVIRATSSRVIGPYAADSSTDSCTSGTREAVAFALRASLRSSILTRLPQMENTARRA